MMKDLLAWSNSIEQTNRCQIGWWHTSIWPVNPLVMIAVMWLIVIVVRDDDQTANFDHDFLCAFLRQLQLN